MLKVFVPYGSHVCAHVAIYSRRLRKLLSKLFFSKNLFPKIFESGAFFERFFDEKKRF